MPISTGSFAEYTIPDEIKAKIPPCFPIAFAGELCSIFGPTILAKDKDGVYGLSYASGTAGWVEAFKAACRKLGLTWLLDYYRSLAWYDSDLFDGEMEGKIVSEFIESAAGQNNNAYYLHLLDAQKKSKSKKPSLTTEEKVALEDKLDQSILSEIGFGKTDAELAEALSLNLVVVANDDLPKGVAVRLMPSKDSKYFGRIEVGQAYNDGGGRCLQEIMRYVFDIGPGNCVRKIFERRT